MNVAICDDDSCFCELLKNKLLAKFHTSCAEIVIIDTYTISQKLVDETAKKNYQILFLDIDMPTENGFLIADRISKILPQCFIVFVTSHDFLVFEAIKNIHLDLSGNLKLILSLNLLLMIYCRQVYINSNFTLLKNTMTS